MKKTIFIAFFLVALVIPLATHAYWVKSGPAVTISKDEVVDGNLYAAGASIIIDGKVKGDIFCAGQNIVINGSVDGDIFCAGQSIIVNGNLGGSLRAAGNSINVNGQVARNLMAFGAAVYLDNKSAIGWDALVGAATVNAGGKIGRSLYGGGAVATISGSVGSDVNLKMDGNNKDNKANLIIAKSAQIAGNVNYTSKIDASIEQGAQIKGKVLRNEPKIPVSNKQNAAIYLWASIYSSFTALVVGLVLIALWKNEIIKLTDIMLAKIGPSIGWGVIALFLTPIIIVLLLITLIGIPLAFILAALWLVTIWVSKVLVGIAIGRRVLEQWAKNKKDSLILAMILGIVISWFIFSLPLLGWIASLVAIWWGLGGIYLFFRKA